ncbi:hypothetical protein A2801_03265 [Candidatus Woesebacteria bacterium RIFCSPHIGHO2_01_FULL_41_10]|uniref:Uncharacterized protein n=1 Tax=Candidatus Woesebacteria bacterium RIFCSPHIGHO2_01_FULL_41_10 TaxID=1802500 RepID=A0A1F7YST1_9BACT|nr:MAG: hypothetical protein A2801_03265 [Candidatus Woesebacteria bacterium RIFCSPHIGHO2_01_FULL_41_10]
MNRDPKKGFSSIGSVLEKFEIEEDKYISREFQKYGYELAEELGDLKHKALYIKLAKEYPRGFLESARAFVKDAQNVTSKGRLFMWKLKQLRDEKKKKLR